MMGIIQQNIIKDGESNIIIYVECTCGVVEEETIEGSKVKRKIIK
jgi:hypothetical protein